MNHEELVSNLKRLRLPTIAADYSETAQQCEKARRSHEQYLASLVASEIEQKRLNRIKKTIKASKIPISKTLEAYDFTCRKGIGPEQAARLASGDFIRKAANVVLYGSFGVGKSHLASALTVAACEAGFHCLFISTHAMIADLVKAQSNLSLTHLFKKLDRFDLITLDELGYTPQNAEGADLFFQLISQRYERRSLLITTNLTYSAWDKVFINPMATEAAVDRIIHNCETFNITGPSWRAETAKRRSQQ
jgi:DNA replication protein DnaC